MAYIEFREIDKYYGDQHVLKKLSLSVEQGQLVTLLGMSGCGKSTLLRCLAGFEGMQGGQIFLDGEDITSKEPRQRSIGMIFQQYSLFPTMTAAANVDFGLKMRGLPKEERRASVEEALHMVGLAGMGGKYPSQLSGGEQQRVALARSLITKPKVLLLDEPFSAIDAKLRKELQARVKSIQRALGTTCIFVTHDQDEAMRMSDVIHLMKDGAIEQSDRPETLYAAPKTVYAASFIGNYNLLSPEDCAKLGVNSAGRWAAIRPETIKLCSEGEETLEGEIQELLPQGNIIRYFVNCRSVLLKVDTLFESSLKYSEGELVRLRIDRECIQFPETSD